MALLDGARSRTVSLRVASRADGAVALTAIHEGTELPHVWRSALAETTWPDLSMLSGSVSSGAVVLLRAARRVAEMHTGRMSLDCSEGRTSFSIVVPAGGA